MSRFEIITLTWGDTGWMLEDALQSRNFKTLRPALDAIETNRVSLTNVILAKADTGDFVGYALLNLDTPNNVVLAAEIAVGYEDSGVLEDIKNRSDALVWLRQAELNMGRMSA